MNLNRKYQGFFSKKSRIERKSRALHYRYQRNYANFSEEELKLEIEDLESKENTWKMLSPLLSVGLITAVFGCLFFALRQLGTFFLTNPAAIKTKLTTQQLFMSKLIFMGFVVFILLLIVIIFNLLLNKHKQRILMLKWLKEAVHQQEEKQNG